MGLYAGDGLDRLCPPIHVTNDPLLSPFPLCPAQFEMAERMVFQLVTTPNQLLRRGDACHSDILFVPRFSPRPRCKPPSHDKKRRLDAIGVKHVD